MTATHRRRITEALNEAQRYIDKESARDPVLRPIEVQKTLAFYIDHATKLRRMLAQQ